MASMADEQQVQAFPAIAAEFLRGYTVEVTARDKNAVETCRANLKPGTEVYIAFVPGESHENVVETAVGLKQAGMVPVPHEVARNMKSRRQLETFLAGLADAGIDRALALGGDVDKPLGPYDSSLQLLETGLFNDMAIRKVGLSFYPEPHPKFSDDLANRELDAKLNQCVIQDLKPWLVSQFAFEAEPILERVRGLRARGVATPLRIGIAGPASRKTLFRYAMVCGVGNSVRALGAKGDMIGQLLAQETPDAVVDGVAAANQAEGLGLIGVHIFTFGGVAGSAKWAAERMRAA